MRPLAPASVRDAHQDHLVKFHSSFLSPLNSTELKITNEANHHDDYGSYEISFSIYYNFNVQVVTRRL